MYALYAANLPRRWFTGEEHIDLILNIKKTQHKFLCCVFFVCGTVECCVSVMLI